MAVSALFLFDGFLVLLAAWVPLFLHVTPLSLSIMAIDAGLIRRGDCTRL
jgi:hypothetical protein